MSGLCSFSASEGKRAHTRTHTNITPFPQALVSALAASADWEGGGVNSERDDRELLEESLLSAITALTMQVC